MADNGLDKFVTGMVFGAAMGAVLGLLLAPKPGSETRQIVRERAGEYLDVAGKGPASTRGRCANGPRDTLAPPGSGSPTCGGGATRKSPRSRRRHRRWKTNSVSAQSG